MEFFDVLASRVSVRRYEKTPLTEEEIAKLLEAAQRSPIGHFDYKNYAIVVVTNPEILALLAKENQEISGQGDLLYGAPVLFLILRSPDAENDTAKLNAGIIAEHIHLAATDMGLGSLCVYSFLRNFEKQPGYGAYCRALHLPEGYQPIMSVAVGHTPIPKRIRRMTPRLKVLRIE